MFEGSHRLSRADGVRTGTRPAPSGESPPYAQVVCGGEYSPLLSITQGSVPEGFDGRLNSVPSGAPGMHFYEKSNQTSSKEDHSIALDTVSSSTENSVDLNTTYITRCTSTFSRTDKCYYKNNQSSTLNLHATNLRSESFNFAELFSSFCSSYTSVIVNRSNDSSFSSWTSSTWYESVTPNLWPPDDFMGLPVCTDTGFFSRIPISILALARTQSDSIYSMIEMVSRFSGNAIKQMTVKHNSRPIPPTPCLPC